MRTMEFEGRTEREAVAKAASALGSESFDVEILEEGGGFFSKGKVKIRVRPLSDIPDPIQPQGSTSSTSTKKFEKIEQEEQEIIPPNQATIKKISKFTEELLEKMGFPSKVIFKEIESNKVVFEIESEDSNIIIGKHGKNLDAIQLLANTFYMHISTQSPTCRIALDSEGYRVRQKETLVRIANSMADEAVRSGSTRLLKPMNPFERRLVHTAINERDDVETRSEGRGMYKKIRIISRNSSKGRSGFRR